MSSDAAPAGSATLADEPHSATDVYSRPLGINRGIVKHRAPICHGVKGSFHLQDTDTEPPSDTPTHRNIPDGSLYQRCRLAWYQGEKRTQETQYGERTYVVLADDPSFKTVPDDDAETAIILTSSKFKAGRGEGADYHPFYKYHIARRPLDDEGEPRLTGSPKYTITATVQPQYEGMVYEDGNALTMPYGEGTSVRAHVNYAPSEGAVFSRVNDLVRAGLGHTLDEPRDSRIEPGNVGDSYDRDFRTSERVLVRFPCLGAAHHGRRTIAVWHTLSDHPRWGQSTHPSTRLTPVIRRILGGSRAFWGVRERAMQNWIVLPSTFDLSIWATLDEI